MEQFADRVNPWESIKTGEIPCLSVAVDVPIPEATLEDYHDSTFEHVKIEEVVDGLRKLLGVRAVVEEVQEGDTLETVKLFYGEGQYLYLAGERMDLNQGSEPLDRVAKVRSFWDSMGSQVISKEPEYGLFQTLTLVHPDGSIVSRRDPGIERIVTAFESVIAEKMTELRQRCDV